MQILKVVMLSSVLFLLTGCSCITRLVGLGGANIPVATDEGPLRDIYFAFDSAKLDSRAKKSLNEAKDYLSTNPSVDVQIEGHCDERGTAEYNLALGERRAKAVQSYLKSKGVDSSRMSTISYGEELPVNPGHNAAAWAKNRRAHFSVD